MQDLLILGAGVHAAEMVEIVARINQLRPTWRLLGLVSHNGKRVGEELNGQRVLAREKLSEFPQAQLASAFEWPKPFTLPRARLITLIDPSTFVSRTAKLGVGCVFYPHCYIGLNARIGDGVFALSGVTINHDNVLEDYVTLTSKATLAGEVYVEAGMLSGPGLHDQAEAAHRPQEHDRHGRGGRQRCAGRQCHGWQSGPSAATGEKAMRIEVRCFEPAMTGDAVAVYNRLTTRTPFCYPITPEIFAEAVSAKSIFEPAGFFVAYAEGQAGGADPRAGLRERRQAARRLMPVSRR